MRGIAGALLLALLLLALLLTTTVNVGAASVMAASCSASDVQAALNRASAGDTVVIPAGTCTWTTGVSWTAPANVTLMGQTVCTGAAATLTCIDNTVINDGMSTADPGLLNIVLPTTGTFRISGITIADPSGHVNNNGELRLGPAGSSYRPLARIDHMHFSQPRQIGWATSNVDGVADHNRYDMTNGTADNATRPFGPDDDSRWNQATNFGTQTSWFYVEDSYFANGIANDCLSSGKQVYRYNYTTNSGFQQHGTGHSGQNRGCRAAEIYGNTINGGATSTTTAFGYYTGPAIVFGNALGSSVFSSAIQATETRQSNYTYDPGAMPSKWGPCGSAYNGTGSVWDGNIDATGYPCLDQVGRGIGDLLSGDFSSKRNNTRNCTVNFAWANRASNCGGTSSSAWPRQALEPAYEWSNTGTVTGSWIRIYRSPASAANIVLDRDIYVGHGNSGCNPGAASCTSGVGVGTLAQRPAQCTTGAESGGGVGWWATDQGGNWNTTNGTANDGALYKCTATNTWTLYYTPYTYPHPLTQTQTQTGPGAPKNLRVG